MVPPFRPEVGRQPGADVHRGSRPQLGRNAPDVQRRQLGPVARRPRRPRAWRTSKRKDLPFHYTLADAFTVCDANHCSMLGPTDPNRYYMWTGWDGNDGKNGGPVIANDELGYGWQTYPERLQQAGISWKIYQDSGEGLDAARFWGWTSDDPYIGNYGDNSLLYFFNYQNATPGSPLYQAARTGTEVNKSGGFFDILAADVQERQAAAGVLDRGARGLHRASGLARRLRRLVHGGRARRAHQRSRGVVQDGPADHVRRERRLLRPRRRALSQRRRPRRASRPCRSTTSFSTARPGRRTARAGWSDRTGSASACRC